jgi:DNA-binding transcriptional ArsR family regulator
LLIGGFVREKATNVGEETLNVGEKALGIGEKTACVGENVGEQPINVGGKTSFVGGKADMKTSILAKLKAQPELSAKDLAMFLGKTPRTIERHIKELREQGLLVRVGADKGGRWEVR